MDTDLAATILSHCSEADLFVSELVRKVGGNHDMTLALIKELERRSLLLPETRRIQAAGRPRQYLRVTPIGRQFIREYRGLQDLYLRSNNNDIRKALQQADLAQALVDQGISPYARFQETNDIARNIARTTKAKRNSR